jgi:hypothetical protein
VQIVWPGIPTRSHGLYGSVCDSSDGAAPTGMHSADRAMLLVYQQNRQAVGGFDSYQQTRCVREQSIPFGQASGPVCIDDDAGVDLAQRSQLVGRFTMPRPEAVVQPVEARQFLGAVGVVDEFEVHGKANQKAKGKWV